MTEEELRARLAEAADIIAEGVAVLDRVSAQRDEAIAVMTVYKGELELTAELLGADSIATIRDEIHKLMERAK